MEKFCLQTEVGLKLQYQSWVSSLPAYPADLDLPSSTADMGLTSLHNCMNQFLKINLSSSFSLIFIHPLSLSLSTPTFSLSLYLLLVLFLSRILTNTLK